MATNCRTLTLPNNLEYSVPQVKMLLREVEEGIKRVIRAGIIG
jgi:hypothetical protein